MFAVCVPGGGVGGAANLVGVARLWGTGYATGRRTGPAPTSHSAPVRRRPLSPRSAHISAGRALAVTGHPPLAGPGGGQVPDARRQAEAQAEQPVPVAQ